jgi:hypothetical protein
LCPSTPRLSQSRIIRDNGISEPILFQRPPCALHAQRLGECRAQGRRVLAAFIGTAFVHDDAEAASKQCHAAFMDGAEADVLAFMTFPKDHRPKIHSVNPLERLNGAIKRRTDVVVPNEDQSPASSARCCSSRQLDRSGPTDDHDGLAAVTPLAGTPSPSNVLRTTGPSTK